MRLFGSVQHKSECTFPFLYNLIFQPCHLLSPLAPLQGGDRHMPSQTFLHEIRCRKTFNWSVFSAAFSSKVSLLFQFFNRITCLNSKYTGTRATFVHVVWQNYETPSRITWSMYNFELYAKIVQNCRLRYTYQVLGGWATPPSYFDEASRWLHLWWVGTRQLCRVSFSISVNSKYKFCLIMRIIEKTGFQQ